MTDAGEKLRERIIKWLEDTRAFGGDESLSLNIARFVRAELERAAGIADDYAKKNPGQHTLRVCNQIASAIRKLKE